MTFEDIRSIRCFKCGVYIHLESDRLTTLRENGESFWCPNGHNQAFKGTDKAELQELRQQVAAKNAAIAEKNAAIQAREHQIAAREREIERLRKRRTCKECSRTFSNDRGLRMHVSRAHSPRRALPKDAGPDAFGSGRGLVDDTVIPIKRGRK